MIIRALAVVLILVSIPTGSFRGPADGYDYDWHFGMPDNGAEFLSEGRKQPDDDEPDGAACGHALAGAAVSQPQARPLEPARAGAPVRLLPHATGPPAA